MARSSPYFSETQVDPVLRPAAPLPRFAAPSGRGAPMPANDSDSAQGDVESPAAERVLIVEDNWLVAIEMEAALQDAGYIVVGIAVSADEAIAACEDQRPDVVLMDIRLQGGSDGVEAAKAIRTRMDVPSIFVSAHDDAETRARGEAARPLGWINKPVQGAVLVERISRLLDRPH